MKKLVSLSPKDEGYVKRLAAEWFGDSKSFSKTLSRIISEHQMFREEVEAKLRNVNQRLMELERKII